jgi:transcriptional regulator with XRE-family HTH domain
MELGDLIFRRRNELGFTQQQLGDRIGASQSYISGLETNRQTSTSGHLVRRLAEVLQLDEAQLLRAGGYVYTAGQSDAVELFVDVLRNLDTSSRDSLIAQLRGLRELQTGTHLNDDTVYSEIYKRISQLSDGQRRRALKAVLTVLDSLTAE